MGSTNIVHQLQKSGGAKYTGKGFDGFFAQLAEAKKLRDAAQQKTMQQ